jgi:hypothetical protein
VWTCGVRPGRDDRLERDGLGTLVVEELLDRPGELPLGAAQERLLDEPVEHAVGDLTRTPDRSQLGGVLDRRSPRRRRAADGLDRATTQRLVTGVGDEVGLETDSPDSRPARSFESARFVSSNSPLRPARRLRVAEVGEEASAILLDQGAAFELLNPKR